MAQNNECIRVLADINQIESCKIMISQSDKKIKLLASILALAGNEVRFKILFIISKENGICVCDLSDVLQMSAAAISQHLR